jgi:hypothetical protein
MAKIVDTNKRLLTNPRQEIKIVQAEIATREIT